MVKTLIEALTYSMPVLLSVGFLTGILLFTSLNMIHRLILGYLGMALIIDLLSRYFGIVYRNNLIFIPVFGFLELLFFAWLYGRYFLRRQPKIWMIVPAAAMGVIVWELCTIEWNAPQRFNAYSRVADPFAIVFLCVLHFREIGSTFPLPTGRIRLNSAVLVFFSLNMIIFLPVNFLINVPSKIKFWFWLVNLLLTLSFYTFLIREIWKNGKTPRSPEPGY